jgi:hypothetical protein
MAYRYRALQRLGIDPSADSSKYFRKAIYAHTTRDIAPHEQDNDARVRAYIISKNIHRRHLTAEQRREVIAKVIAAKPEASDRQIAKQVKADHKTVGAIRKAKEATGEVPPVDKRVGGDGRARNQPKPKRGKPQQLPDDPEGREERDRLIAEIKTELSAAEQNKQEALSAMKGLVEVLMQANPQVRVQYFALLWDNFRDEMIKAQSVSIKKVWPNHDAIYADGNAPPPDVGADNMRAQIAVIVDGPTA